MKTLYLLKSSINNSHRIICQDNTNVALEKVDSVFAKLYYHNSSTHTQGTFSLEKMQKDKKKISMNYSHDEAIKKYNEKANEANNQALSKQFANKLAKENLLSDFAKRNIGIDSQILDNLKSISSDDISINQKAIESKTETENMVLVLVNPYKLRDYSFSIPEYITMILNMTAKSKVLVYCPLDLNSPLESSEINYLFPIIFNTQTKFAAQIPLSIMDYPDFHKQKLRLYL